jgi:NADH-quinone oxidoreductase subunit L
VLPLIPLFPFIGFLINALLGRRLSKSVAGGLACLVMLASFAISVMEVWRLAAMPVGAGAPAREITQTVFTWISSGSFQLDIAFRLDPLSAVMILVITGIGSLIHIYSTAYMHEETDSEFARYFSYLNLFVFFMLLLVLGSNVLVMFIGWEGVGLCSYLLIGYYYVKKSASDAANKAFIVNRIGDYAFLLGTLLLVVTVAGQGFASPTLDFKEIAARVAGMPVETAAFGTLSLIALLFFIGATGKSAQIPLYVWLPDAMEGPTPVSALIHAATMVTAGVYMIGRTSVLFEHAPLTMMIVAVTGALTALLAGTIGLVQNDIKRVLAYSTVSQLGYMFLAMGVGAFGAGIFHLYTHAFFKALLFLGSGAVIHALHGEQDIRNMGGLRKYLPVTYWTFIIGSLAIAGVPGLAGFFSKDEILFETYSHGHQWLWGIGIVTALLTATYMFRLVHLTFHGAPRFALAGHPVGFSGPHAGDPHDAPEPAHTHAHGHDSHAGGHAADAVHGNAQRHAAGHGGHGHGAPHDAPPAMALALVVLAIGSVLAGYIGLPHAIGHNRLGEWLAPAFEAPAAGLSGMTMADCAPGAAPAGTTSAAPPQPTVADPLAGLTLGDCAPVPDVVRVANVQAPGELAQPADPAHPEAADEAHDETALEWTLMGISTLVAFAGIGLATMIWLRRPQIADRMAASMPLVYRTLLNKYYVDEFYDATIVQPVKVVSEEGLWRGMDARVVDGAVNGTGQVVGGVSAVLRLLQSGSVKAYAASTFFGVVAILAYYLWR